MTVDGIFNLDCDGEGNLYVASSERTADKAVYRFDGGTDWLRLGSADHRILAAGNATLVCDTQGNLYAPGYLKDAARDVSRGDFIAKWDGKEWTELGADAPLRANGQIYGLAADGRGRIAPQAG